jgi:membrane associated rhomboid family serine protease
MGSGGFLLTYFAAGIFGCVVQQLRHLIMLRQRRNVLGGNFALVGSPSVGASGAIFGTLAVSRCQNLMCPS